MGICHKQDPCCQTGVAVVAVLSRLHSRVCCMHEVANLTRPNLSVCAHCAASVPCADTVDHRAARRRLGEVVTRWWYAVGATSKECALHGHRGLPPADSVELQRQASAHCSSPQCCLSDGLRHVAHAPIRAGGNHYAMAPLSVQCCLQPVCCKRN